jgi:hypothetical protein
MGVKLDVVISAQCHKQTWERRQSMSAFGIAQTSQCETVMFAYDPKRISAAQQFCINQPMTRIIVYRNKIKIPAKSVKLKYRWAH